jgi:hypothetical protein
MNNKELYDLAEQFGGSFHGPNVEHLSIPETQYYLLAQDIVNTVLDELAEEIVALGPQSIAIAKGKTRTRYIADLILKKKK